MKSQLWKGFTGTGSRVQVGKQQLFVVPLSKTRVIEAISPPLFVIAAPLSLFPRKRESIH